VLPKDRLLKELETLNNSNILRLYDIALTLKEQEKLPKRKSSKDYLRVRPFKVRIASGLPSALVNSTS